ncbi:MAG TPA: class IV adenylate cyclase [Patescibacteria group bacterium]|nr:class IV adenylate cyclase [Patescibacteria group bacterium]
MKPEIEAKFLSVDHDVIRAKLKELGSENIRPLTLMRRKNYDYPDFALEKRGGWVRVRDEGSKVTMSYKQLNDRGLHGTHEVELVVNDFDVADGFLTAIGLRQDNYQETKRESWRLDDVEIDLDEWPWIQPFIEIEGPSEEQVRDVADKLGLDWAAACHGSVEVAYQAEYDVTEEEIDHLPTIVFSDPPPAVLKKKAA